MCVCGCLVAKACKFTRPVGGNCALPYLKGWRKFARIPVEGFCYLPGDVVTNVLVGDFATKVPAGGFCYRRTCEGRGCCLPKDFVTKEPVVGFCYQSTCGGILLPKYLWWDFVTKVPVGGFVTKIPVGGSGNLELLCPKANCFLGGFVGSLHGAMLPSSTCGAQPLNVTGGAQPLKRDGPQKSEQEKTFLAVQIFRAQPLNTRNRLAKCQPSSVHFDSKIRGKSKHSCTCQPVYLPLRKCRSK